MPIVEVTHDRDVEPATLRTLAEVLPHAVSIAVDCPEEPYDGALRPGDVDVRFRPRGPYDAGGLAVVVEIRSKWFASRAANRQERCDRLCDALLEAAGTTEIGVYLCLPVAVWSDGESPG